MNTSLMIHGYEVFCGNIEEQLPTWLSEQTYSQIIVLVDENTKTLCLPELPFLTKYPLIEIKAGEAHKSIETCQKVWTELLALKIDRNALLINLGGGVISDLGGFVAATYKRGIDWINIPTTLLAQVDATIGGKLGVNAGGQKNMIGLFQNPQAIFIATFFHNTQEERQLNSGSMELFKHGCIANENHIENLFETTFYPETLILESILIKKKIVEQDPFEQGLRKVLNFGHTLGHAFESLSLKISGEPLLHGEAVGWGMIAALFLSNELLDFDAKKQEQLNKLILQKLPSFPFRTEHSNELLGFIRNDKKNNDGKTKMVLLKAVAEPEYDIEVDDNQLINAINYCIEL